MADCPGSAHQPLPLWGLPYLGPISLLAAREQGRPCHGCHGRDIPQSFGTK